MSGLITRHDTYEMNLKSYLIPISDPDLVTNFGNQHLPNILTAFRYASGFSEDEGLYMFDHLEDEHIRLKDIRIVSNTSEEDKLWFEISVLYPPTKEDELHHEEGRWYLDVFKKHTSLFRIQCVKPS